MVIAELSQGSYVQAAGNVVELAGVQLLLERLAQLAAIDKTELKTISKQQLRSPRDEGQSLDAGLGLIEVARRVTASLECSLNPLDACRAFFTLRSTISSAMTELNSVQVRLGMNLNLTDTLSTPAIQVSWDSGLLRKSGESYPENT